MYPAYSASPGFKFPFPLARQCENVMEELAILQTKKALLGTEDTGKKVLSWAYLTAAVQPEHLSILELFGIDIKKEVHFTSNNTLPGIGTLARVSMTIQEYLAKVVTPPVGICSPYIFDTAFTVYLTGYTGYLSRQSTAKVKTGKGEVALLLTSSWGKLKAGSNVCYRTSYYSERMVVGRLLSIDYGTATIGTFSRSGYPKSFKLQGDREVTLENLLPKEDMAKLGQMTWHELLQVIETKGIPPPCLPLFQAYLERAIPEMPVTIVRETAKFGRVKIAISKISPLNRSMGVHACCDVYCNVPLVPSKVPGSQRNTGMEVHDVSTYDPSQGRDTAPSIGISVSEYPRFVKIGDEILPIP